jgi:hypothetical protein
LLPAACWLLLAACWLLPAACCLPPLMCTSLWWRELCIQSVGMCALSADVPCYCKAKCLLLFCELRVGLCELEAAASLAVCVCLCAFSCVDGGARVLLLCVSFLIPSTSRLIRGNLLAPSAAWLS